MTIEDSPQALPLWHVTLADLEKSLAGNEVKVDASTSSPATVSVQVVDKLRKEGASVMEGEVAKQKREQKMAKTDAEWFKTVLKKGTVSDRISALTLAFQASPLHGLEHFKGLLEMAKSKSRHEALLALDALKDLLCQPDAPLFPPGRKLRYMHQQPVSCLSASSAEIRRQAALFWYFEESLKVAYLEIIKIAEILSQDPILHARERGCRLIYDLLRANPFEQEANVLALLANKLGDSERRLASRMPFYFSELVNAHPRHLTTLAIEHVRQVIDRPGVADRCKYYALTFLVQIRLVRSNPAATAGLLQIYLGLFKTYIINSLAQESKDKKFTSKRQKRLRHLQKQRGAIVDTPIVAEEHARMAKMLLTGINRAFPFASNAGEELKQLLLSFAVPLLQLCSPRVAFPTTIQALNLLLTLAPHDQSLRQSVLQAIQSLLDGQDRLRGASASHPLVIRVIGRSLTMMIDSNDRAGVEALLKSLLRFCLSIISPGFVVASLVLLEATLSRYPGLKSMLHVAPDGIDSARTSSAFELVALTRHYHPRIRRYATSILRTCRASTPSDAEVNAAPFEKICFSLFLDVWSRMRRISSTKKSSKNLNDNESGSEEDDLADRVFAQAEARKRAPKLTDNAKITAQLYAQDEYKFVAEFAEEKDRRLAVEEAKQEKGRKEKKRGGDGDDLSHDDDAEDNIEAEADAFMEETIKGMIPDEDEDIDFGPISDDSEDVDEEGVEDEEIEDEDQSGSEIEEELESFDEEEAIDEIDEEDEAAFSDVSHDSDDINMFLKDSDAEIEDLEEIEPAVEAEPVVEDKKIRKKKVKLDTSKLYKGVFASASDYEDALKD